jgi:unsaturated rhamnogalacturonyl hydrolase
MRPNFFYTLILAMVVTAWGCNTSKKTTSTYFSGLPSGSTPQEVGNLVAQRFLEVPHPNFGRPEPPVRISYPEICAWYGALTFARATQNKKLVSLLAQRFEPLFTTESGLVPNPDHVDHTVFAAVPLELYMQTKENRYLTMGQVMADTQWAKPWSTRASALSWHYYNKGMSWQTRMWIDDMFMITMAQAQAYRSTGNRKYIDRAASEMVLYLDSLQKPNGLFYHAPDVPFFWGRGDGWMAAGMAELLRSLPNDNLNRTRIMQGYKTMMASLLKYQAENGMWRQLIDDPEAWPETSCTGMFAFAMITGVKEGWLDAKRYGPAARKAWLALTSYINANGDIREVCQGTNKKNDRQYYLDRQRIVGDMHGQAPVLWCATALLR